MAKTNLKYPWKVSYFSEIENRRIIEGMHPKYGTLGHIGASGYLRQLLAGNYTKKHKVIIESINIISKMNPPVDWGKFYVQLNNLIELGLTMKVWGRFLALVRPDLYCTVSSKYVQKELSDTLHVPRTYFTTIEGYINLIKMIHSSPWFRAGAPKNKTSLKYWQNRVALMDPIFYKWETED